MIPVSMVLCGRPLARCVLGLLISGLGGCGSHAKTSSSADGGAGVATAGESQGGGSETAEGGGGSSTEQAAGGSSLDGGEASSPSEGGASSPSEGGQAGSCAGCTIAEHCYAPGAANPAEPCEVCLPSLRKDAFSATVEGTTCDDGDACTSGDVCALGRCSGNAIICDDEVDCNGVEACDPVSGACSPGVSTCAQGYCDPTQDSCVSLCQGCLIDGVCYSEGDASAIDPCWVCDPARSTSSLSANVNAACGPDDGNPCLDAGVCSETGECERSPIPSGTPCGAGVGECSASTCDGAGSCTTAFHGVEVLCGNPAAPCRGPDHCDGGGACTPGEPSSLGAECAEHAICSGTALVPECTCAPGYESSAGSCVEIAECERGDYSPLCAPWTHVSSSNLSTCALSAGALFCWGDNAEAELATGDRLPRSVPTRSGSRQDWDLVEMGYNHACGIAGGELYCWGSPGALGHTGNGLAPERVGTDADWVSVSAGIGSTCGIRSGGSLYCWGWNEHGQVGQGTQQSSYSTPQPVTLFGPATSVSMSGTTVCAIASGRLYCWGSAAYDEPDRFLPVRVTDFEDWTALDLSSGGGCAIRAGGALYCWGSHGDRSDTPKQILGRDDWTHVSTDFGHYCGLTQSGQAYCGGSSNDGALGNGSPGASDVPVEVLSTGAWSQIEAGNQVTFGIRDGGLYAWGSNENGRRGTGSILGRVGTASDWFEVSTASAYTCGLREPGDLYCWGAIPERTASMVPSRIGTESDWSSIVSGWTHVCGVRQGALYCFGSNQDGQLGDGTTTPQPNPLRVGTDASWVAVGANSGAVHHTCAVNAGGELYCWGANANGQLGIGTTEPSHSPKLLSGLGWTAVSLGVRYSCGVRSGALYCWGDASTGGLGSQRTSGNQLTPLKIGSGSAWASVSAGFNTACGLLADVPTCWGSNTFGQLGIGTLTGAFSQVDSGTFTHCAVSDQGSLHCSGRNGFGQLATGDFENRSTPAQVAGSGWQRVSTDAEHTCAIRGGELYCWGRNVGGSLGTGEGLSPMPVQQSP